MTRQAAGLMPDLATWRAWERSRRRTTNALRGAKARVRPVASAAADLHVPSGPIRTVVMVEKLTPSCRAAIVEPLRHLSPETTAVLTPQGADVSDVMPGLTRQAYDGPDQFGADVRGVLSLGAYLQFSDGVAAWARRREVPFFLVQHGLLTPSSPPASEGAQVLAWSERDAEFWSRNRPDLGVITTGSQMLWDAGRLPGVEVASDRPVMLGQLHGAELPRMVAMRTYWEACRRFGMDYRPHPNEGDAVSRALHEVMRRGGIRFDVSGTPLPELARPVVSIFSTGTLEAAMRGLPAWVIGDSTPPWVRDFWRRYGLRPWGEDPTPAWPMPQQAPAAQIADVLEGRR